MTKELLERYPDICGELYELNEAGPLCDSDQKRAESLLDQKAEIERFAASLPWNKRQLIQTVMKYGTRWDVVRRELHSYKSADALRMEYNRIFL